MNLHTINKSMNVHLTYMENSINKSCEDMQAVHEVKSVLLVISCKRNYYYFNLKNQEHFGRNILIICISSNVLWGYTFFKLINFKTYFILYRQHNSTWVLT